MLLAPAPVLPLAALLLAPLLVRALRAVVVLRLRALESPRALPLALPPAVEEAADQRGPPSQSWSRPSSP